MNAARTGAVAANQLAASDDIQARSGASEWALPAKDQATLFNLN